VIKELVQSLKVEHSITGEIHGQIINTRQFTEVPQVVNSDVVHHIDHKPKKPLNVDRYDTTYTLSE